MKIQFNTFNSLFATKALSAKKVNNVSYPNLAPLAQDTVSFTGRSELVASDMSTAPSSYNCLKTEINAEPAAYYLEKVLDHYITPLTVKPKGKKAVKPLDAQISTRIKSSTSIREKVVSKHAKLYRKEYKTFISSFMQQLKSNFGVQKDISEDDVLSFIYQSTKHDNADTKYSPYANVPYVVSELLSILDENNIIDLSSIDNETYKEKYREMVDVIESGYQSSLLDENGTYVKPSSIAGIKRYANDIVGSRIILEDSNPRYIELVFDALKRASDDGLLKITSIENNIPSKDNLPAGTTIEDYQYATDEQLKDFAKATGAELDTNITKTGYIALHINVDLSDDMFKPYGGIFNGFTGEIQIMGRDVEQLKDIEDLCYKLKDNKNAYKRVYEPFKQHFKPLYDKHKDAFDEYTYKLYLAQRAKTKRKTSSPLMFPTAVELGYTEEQIPSSLDFNRLAIKKCDCDQDKKELEKENLSKKKTAYNLYLLGDISTMQHVVFDKIYKKSQS